MKIIIAAIAASLAFPTTASAETWWLVLSERNGGVGAGAITIDLETIPMESEE